mmetsp:Transcript_43189/g.101544  ORF Transcript_43189/g.101544 Transcript_43189/m.101544 type:complete len:159 (-) Transcript_43189:99-575(-)
MRRQSSSLRGCLSPKTWASMIFTEHCSVQTPAVGKRARSPLDLLQSSLKSLQKKAPSKADTTTKTTTTTTSVTMLLSKIPGKAGTSLLWTLGFLAMSFQSWASFEASVFGLSSGRIFGSQLTYLQSRSFMTDNGDLFPSGTTRILLPSPTAAGGVFQR